MTRRSIVKSTSRLDEEWGGEHEGLEPLRARLFGIFCRERPPLQALTTFWDTGYICTRAILTHGIDVSLVRVPLKNTGNFDS